MLEYGYGTRPVIILNNTRTERQDNVMVKLTKRRSDSFFGLHFDFHPTADIVVGDNLRYDVVAKLLDETKPDYVQVDTKGHPLRHTPRRWVVRRR